MTSRKLPAWLLAITFVASWWGGGSAIDLIDNAHKNGLSSFWIYGAPVLLATALMFLFAKGIRLNPYPSYNLWGNVMTALFPSSYLSYSVFCRKVILKKASTL